MFDLVGLRFWFIIVCLLCFSLTAGKMSWFLLRILQGNPHVLCVFSTAVFAADGLSDNSFQLDFAKYCTNITHIDNISQADMSA